MVREWISFESQIRQNPNECRVSDTPWTALLSKSYPCNSFCQQDFGIKGIALDKFYLKNKQEILLPSGNFQFSREDKTRLQITENTHWKAVSPVRELQIKCLSPPPPYLLQCHKGFRSLTKNSTLGLVDSSPWKRKRNRMSSLPSLLSST